MSKIEKLKAAYEAATSGEWESAGCYVGQPAGLIAETFGLIPGKNAEFIALAHNLMPFLLDAVSHLQDLFQQADEDMPQDARTGHFTSTLSEVLDFLEKLK
jgi:hypothetical protein